MNIKTNRSKVNLHAAALLALLLQTTPVLSLAQTPSPSVKVTARIDQVGKMLSAAAAKDANAVWDAKTEIEELPYPARGDRRAARRLNTTALEKFKADQVPQALADFEKAIQADPSDQEIANNYGYALYKSNRLAEAEAQLRYTLALAPARAAAWANLAEVFGAQGQSERSADAFVVSHRFSRNPDTTRQYIEKFSTTSDVPALKAGATQALARLFPPAAATAQPLAGTTQDRVQQDGVNVGNKVAAQGTTEPPKTTAPTTGPVIPPSVANPNQRLQQSLPNPEILPLFIAATKGSADARETLLKLANAGNARAQNAVGTLYDAGLGVESNHELANTWYRKSAAAGFVLAQESLAWNLEHGIGGPMDKAMAFENYRRAAEQGHPYAMNNLAVMYFRGSGVAQEKASAFSWFKRSAEAGLSRGAHNTATMMELGIGQGADLKLAAAYYLSAAATGFPQSQYKVATSYEYGWIGAPDKTSAIDWYKKAALQGLEPAKDALKRLGVTDY